MLEQTYDPPLWKLILVGVAFVALFAWMTYLRIKERRKG